MAAIDQAGTRRQEAHEWVARLTSGNATVADADAAKLWCSRSPAHAQAFAEATILWEALEPAAREVARQEANVGLFNREAASQVRFGRRALLGGALAASAATAGYLTMRPPLGLWRSFGELAADYRTGTGERRNVAIDGVAVELNTRSSLNVLPANGGTRRLELVAGEAVFGPEDSAASPLVLIAGGGQVSATEARFDVRCDGAEVSVTCLHGNVQVDYRGRGTVLQERQQVVYGSFGLGSVAIVDPAVATAWRDGRLIFHSTPLATVIDEVNRYRRGKIVLMNGKLGQRRVEVTLPLDRTDELMALLRDAYGVAITTLPGGIVILT